MTSDDARIIADFLETKSVYDMFCNYLDGRDIEPTEAETLIDKLRDLADVIDRQWPEKERCVERYRKKMTSEEFDAAILGTRLEDKSIAIAREYLVIGVPIAEVAKRHGVTRERVREIVARVAKQ